MSPNPRALFVPPAFVDGKSYESNFTEWEEILRRITTLNQLTVSYVSFNLTTLAVIVNQYGPLSYLTITPDFDTVVLLLVLATSDVD